MGWWLPLVRCPVSGDELALEEGNLEAGILRASDTVLRYPVIGGVPFLVPNVEHYLARHHDAVLASLAEVGLATKDTVERLSDFSKDVRTCAARFEDDWTDSEVDPSAPRFVVPQSDVGKCLGDLFAFDRSGGAKARMLQRFSDASPIATSIEIGVGAGNFVHALAECSTRTMIVDISPRAAFRMRGLPNVAPLVMDAEALAFAPAVADLVVAANLIDLVDAPLSFLTGVADVLRLDGQLLLTTPDPWPWEGASSLAAALFEHAGLRLESFEDDLPWLRDHGPRELQLFLVQLLSARRNT